MQTDFRYRTPLRNLNTHPGEAAEQFVALWYQQGEAVMGRVWNQVYCSLTQWTQSYRNPLRVARSPPTSRGTTTSTRRTSDPSRYTVILDSDPLNRGFLRSCSSCPSTCVVSTTPGSRTRRFDTQRDTQPNHLLMLSLRRQFRTRYSARLRS